VILHPDVDEALPPASGALQVARSPASSPEGLLRRRGLYEDVRSHPDHPFLAPDASYVSPVDDVPLLRRSRGPQLLTAAGDQPLWGTGTPAAAEARLRSARGSRGSSRLGRACQGWSPSHPSNGTDSGLRPSITQYPADRSEGEPHPYGSRRAPSMEFGHAADGNAASAGALADPAR
jgi:hypothetical protein